MSTHRLFLTEPQDYRTATDKDYPEFSEKIRKVAGLVHPPLSPTEADQFVERWGTFLRANDVALEKHALELFNGILQVRTKNDPDTMNIDPPTVFCRSRNVANVQEWLRPSDQALPREPPSAFI